MKRILLLLATLSCGCAMRPEGEDAERARADSFAFAKPIGKRTIPPLGPEPTLEEVVQHALHASPALEVEYHKWRAALERIPQVSSQLTTAEIGFSVVTGTGQPSLLDRTELLAATDSSFGLVWPGKLAAQGRAALEAARAAGFHFDQMRGELRADVVVAYVDLALAGELRSLLAESLGLHEATLATLESRVRTGNADPQDLVRASLQRDLTRNEMAALGASEVQRLARLNALVGRPDPTTPLRARMPAPRPLGFDEERLLEHLRDRNPEIKEHLHEVLAAVETLSAKRKEWIPELSLSTSIAKATQNLGAGITLPFLRSAAIQGEIAEAAALLEEASAYRRMMQADMARDAVVELSLWKDATRQVELFRTSIVPAAERALQLLRTSYGVGKTGFLDLVEAQRTLVDARRMALLVRAERERAQAQLERIAHAHDDPGHAPERAR